MKESLKSTEGSNRVKNSSKKFNKNKGRGLKKQKHAKSETYECTFCGKCYEDNRRLSNHLRAHSGKKPRTQSELCKCTVCGKRFDQRWEVFYHMREHEVKNPETKPELLKNISKPKTELESQENIQSRQHKSELQKKTRNWKNKRLDRRIKPKHEEYINWNKKYVK